ncbi:hypothetical protein PUNSTDRAFT_114974 [Punctularia strigosozonata HHB-11173 SS5]|uniref:uncharacterized protein n=1 Tax=Punctularia strigosozonata (strain HHB-11173) TaxID=741275 RepID=UPI000441782E|nr:uncharacterized protein PUNSTDRAFT_114974 [Punctularia strigosozonata HHB-11173 SS5]EIN06392.1 hypothetical protein PUNSTDRAFT_114974 [Punctularia strigosozonata HHB-11173 SS5]
MSLGFLAYITLAFLCQNVYAQTWYFLRYQTPSGAAFTHLSGNMIAPTLPEAATYYLWPGLQPPDNSGVLQQVLDGRSGTWWIGSGWCCSNPSLAWGSGFNVAAGTTIAFSNDDSNRDGTWDTSLSDSSSSATGSFDLYSTRSMNQAIFAIELYDVSWNFGKLTFTDVVMVANTTSTSWCTNGPSNYNNAAVVQIATPTVTVSGASSTCSVSSIVLVSPA